MQLVYFLIMQEIRANYDYEGNNVDLTSRNVGGVATDIYIKIKDPGNPENTREYKTGTIDYMAAKFEIMVAG